MLQTEFEFELPRGYMDKEGNLHKKGVMRIATAKDEIAPLQDFRVKTNEAYMIIILLARVLVKLGSLNNIDTTVIERLYATDLSFLQKLYEKINSDEYGSSVVQCPHCNKSYSLSISEVLSSGE